MSYADLPTLLARAGRLAKAWTETSDPDVADLLVMIRDVAAELDAELAAAGVTLPVADRYKAALAGTNADGALILAIEGTFPDGGPEVDGILNGARSRYQAAIDAIRAGVHPVVRPAVDDGTAALTASSFWDSEAFCYGYPGSRAWNEWAGYSGNPALAPAVFRDDQG